jgi:hypothetical protein
MKVHHQREASPRRGFAARLRGVLRSRPFIILLYSAVVFGTGAVLSGLFADRLHRHDLTYRDAYSRLRGIVGAIPGSVDAKLTRPPVEHLVLDVKYKHYSKLAEKRAEAMASFHLEATDDDYVPAEIRYRDETLDARIRLKGDWIDHLNSKKWSFRVKLRGESTLFGMKRFSLQHPKTRNYIYEWIYHEALRREGLIALRYDFVEVTLNGDNLGIYAIEEHFEKRVVENAERLEGPIVRFDEGLMFKLQLQHRPFREIMPHEGVTNTAVSSTIDPYLAAEIDAFQSNRALEDPALLEKQTRAIQLLESFRRGDLRTSEVFDVESLARFFAVSDLLGAGHSSAWRNTRFYFNPITSLLEPIAFDGDAGASISYLTSVVNTLHEDRAAVGERRGPFIRRLFEDLEFFEEYVQALAIVADPAYLDALWADLDEELERNLGILRSEFLQFPFSKSVMQRNQEYIRVALNPLQALHAYQRRSDGNEIELELGNLQSLAIEVLGLTLADGSFAAAPPNTVLSPALAFPPRPVEYVPVVFTGATPAGSPQDQPLRVRYRILGLDRVDERDVIAWPHATQDMAEADVTRRASNVETFRFIEVDESAAEITIQPGTWAVDRDMIIPPGYRVLAGEGTRLILSNSALILSHSSLHFVGTSEHPIMVQCEQDGGQGVIVLQAGETSILRHVAFEGLASPIRTGWTPPGAVTFYESPVHISDCRFISNRSEDSLHIVRSQFTMERTEFRGAPFDAFDSDFSEGTVQNVRFVDIGNDAIDVSGSAVELRDIVVDGSGDKALSAGERSNVRVWDMSVRAAAIGMASKDSSWVGATNFSISEGPIGFAAFRKKSEFGPASIEVRGVTLEDVETPYLVEKESSVSVDGRQVPSTEEDLKGLLYDEVN